MAVAQIPRFGRGAVHQPIIAFGGPDDAGILRGVEISVAVAAEPPQTVGQQLVELLDSLILARVLVAVDDRTAIFRWLALPGSKAPVAAPRRRCRLRIDAVEIGDDGVDRGAEAVDVEPAKGGAPFRRQVLIVLPQPIEKPHNLGIAPHPGRKAAERRRRIR